MPKQACALTFGSTRRRPMNKTFKTTVVIGMIAVGLATTGVFCLTSSFAEEFRALPAPASEAAPSTQASETAVLAGGCFWGVQGVFQHVAGVTGAVSGYAGGEASTAQYEMVGMGTTGHAEAV